jgi:fatty acid-binding protein DegV
VDTKLNASAQGLVVAESVAKILIHKTGIKPRFIEQASPVIALHAGRGSVSLSIMRKAV